MRWTNGRLQNDQRARIRYKMICSPVSVRVAVTELVSPSALPNDATIWKGCGVDVPVLRMPTPNETDALPLGTVTVAGTVTACAIPGGELTESATTVSAKGG